MGMRIQASMGRLPRNAKMHKRLWRLTLTADDIKTQEFLSQVYLEVRDGNIGYWAERMRKARKNIRTYKQC